MRILRYVPVTIATILTVAEIVARCPVNEMSFRPDAMKTMAMLQTAEAQRFSQFGQIRGLTPGPRGPALSPTMNIWLSTNMKALNQPPPPIHS